jgi:hypothetical protein
VKRFLTHPVSLAIQYYLGMLANCLVILSGISFTYNPSAALQSNLESIALFGMAPFSAAIWVGLLNAFVAHRAVTRRTLLAFAAAMASPFWVTALVLWLKASSNSDIQAVLGIALGGYGMLVLTSLVLVPTLIVMIKRALLPGEKP